MSPARSYDGPALDCGWQYIGECPSLEEEADDVVYATEPDNVGEERTEDVPVPTEETTQDDDLEGQTTLGDWGRVGIANDERLEDDHRVGVGRRVDVVDGTASVGTPNHARS